MEQGRLDRSDARFATTRWTLVHGLRSPIERERSDAMAELCKRYWPPVYAYLRRRGRGRDAAAELTQAFFAEVVIWRELFEQADRTRGRLRSLVLAALKRYEVDQHRRSAVRGQSVDLRPYLEREDSLLSESTATDLECVFDRRWALAIVEQALRECERHFVTTGKLGHWRLFERRVLAHARGHEVEPLEKAAPACGFASAAAGAAAVQVVRDRLRAVLSELALENGDGAESAPVELLGMLGPG